MDAISRVPGWRHTRRLLKAGLPEGEVELAQFHDYDLENGLQSKEFTHATSTDWYKDMMAKAVIQRIGGRMNYLVYCDLNWRELDLPNSRPSVSWQPIHVDCTTLGETFGK
jgi:hypothetical protein